jgi:hypothetical protein
MESTKSSSARDGLVSSANGLQQTCSKKIWRRGGGAKIAEQKANLHGIIRSHRIGLSIKFLRSHDHIMLLALAFQTFLAFLPVEVPFQATIGVGRCVGVVLVKTSFAAGITRLR